MGRKRAKKKRKNKKNMIILFVAIASFILSGIFMGFGMRQSPAPEQEDGLPNLIEYETERILGEAFVTLAFRTGDYKIIPRSKSSLSQSSVTQVLNAGIPESESIELEVSPKSLMFHVSGSPDKYLLGDIEDAISLPGGFDVFDIWLGASEQGDIMVVAKSVKAGSMARILVTERIRDGSRNILGFHIGNVAAGPYFQGRVLQIDGYSFEAINDKNISSEEIGGIFEGAYDIIVSDSRPHGISFGLGPEFDVQDVIKRLYDEGFHNVSASKTGLADVPEAILLDGEVFIMPGETGVLQAAFFLNASVNDSVKLSITPMSIGDTATAFGFQIAGHAT